MYSDSLCGIQLKYVVNFTRLTHLGKRIYLYFINSGSIIDLESFDKYFSKIYI